MTLTQLETLAALGILGWVGGFALGLLVGLALRRLSSRVRAFEVPSYALARTMRGSCSTRLTRTDPDGTRTRVSREA